MNIFYHDNNPSLPQNDSAVLKKKRAEQIVKARTEYIWTDDFENVVGVPMSETVPDNDKPTIEWFSKVIEVVLEIIENTILNAGDENKGDIDTLLEIKKHFYKVKDLFDENQNDEGILGFVEEQINTIKQLCLSDMKGVVGELEQLKIIFSRHYSSMPAASEPGLAPYKNLFQSIVLNPVAEDFQDDRIFANFRVAGPNPMLITGIQKIPENFPVTNEGYQSVMGSADSLSAALAENRLFLLDYHELQALVDNPGTYNGVNKQLFAPMALFASNAAATGLVPVAIQRTQKADEFPVVYATQNPAVITGHGKRPKVLYKWLMVTTTSCLFIWPERTW